VEEQCILLISKLKKVPSGRHIKKNNLLQYLALNNDDDNELYNYMKMSRIGKIHTSFCKAPLINEFTYKIEKKKNKESLSIN